MGLAVLHSCVLMFVLSAFGVSPVMSVFFSTALGIGVILAKALNEIK